MGGASGADEPTVVLHSSWSGIVLSALGAVLLTVVAILLALGDAIGWIIVVLAVAAVGAWLVVLFDMPVASAFSASGVTRRTMLRRHHLPWDRISRLSRHRSGFLRTRLDQTGGGLVAVAGSRRYALVDRMESAIEFDELVRILGERAEWLGIGSVARPPDGRSPTWMYRTKKWRAHG